MLHKHVQTHVQQSSYNSTSDHFVLFKIDAHTRIYYAYICSILVENVAWLIVAVCANGADVSCIACVGGCVGMRVLVFYVCGGCT